MLASQLEVISDSTHLPTNMIYIAFLLTVLTRKTNASSSAVTVYVKVVVCGLG